MSELDSYSEAEKQKAIQSLLQKQAYNHQYNQEHVTERAEYDRQRSSQYYQEHKDKKVQYYQEHKEGIAERNREHKDDKVRYNQEHANEIKECQRRYRQEHKGEVTECHHQYNREHKGEIAEQHRRYAQEHPEIIRTAIAERRARVANAGGHFTVKEFKTLCEAYENKCAYCKRELPLGPDHKIPLSRGGSNNIENIVPACKRCNNTKHTKTFDEFVKGGLRQ